MGCIDWSIDFGVSVTMTLMSWQNVEVKQRNLISAKQKR